jgi:hypothetical protein
LQAQQRSDPNQRELYNSAQIHLYQQSKANRNSILCERAILQADEDGGWEETKETHHISSVHETQTSSVADPKEMDRISSVGDDCNSDEIHDIGLSQHNFPARPRIVPINMRLPGIAAKYNIDDPEFFRDDEVPSHYLGPMTCFALIAEHVSGMRRELQRGNILLAVERGKYVFLK